MAIDMSQLDTVQWLRYGYLGAAYGVILIAITPPLSRRFLSYGPRAAQEQETQHGNKKDDDASKNHDNNAKRGSFNPLSSLLDLVASFTVPHDWFASFYFLSLSLCAFWPGEVLALQGPLWRMFRDYTTSAGPSMSFTQLQTTWAMLLIQSGRRLWECLDLPSSSESQMFVGHFVMGMAFYAATSVAVWIEGIKTLEAHSLTTSDLVLRSPSLRSIVSILLFLFASGFQHDVHAYLAHLKTPAESKPDDPVTPTKTYRLPTHPAFAVLICPHYFAEVIIYLAMAINAAPKGNWVNGTLGCALLLVGINLGVTAWGTKEWYVRKFGPESVRRKWRVLPFVY